MTRFSISVILRPTCHSRSPLASSLLRLLRLSLATGVIGFGCRSAHAADDDKRKAQIEPPRPLGRLFLFLFDQSERKRKYNSKCRIQPMIIAVRRISRILASRLPIPVRLLRAPAQTSVRHRRRRARNRKRSRNGRVIA